MFAGESSKIQTFKTCFEKIKVITAENKVKHAKIKITRKKIDKLVKYAVTASFCGVDKCSIEELGS